VTTPIASCPSKIIIAGEYAVLDGAEAVVIAIDRRARAFHSDATPPPRTSAFVRAVRERIASELGEDHAATRAAARLEIDTSALYHQGEKLGLGSSAAACAVATGAALIAGGEPLELERAHALAHAAHFCAQAEAGAGGSGVDVAACVFGGVIAARTRGSSPCEVRRLPLLVGLHMVAVWTGKSADTRELVAAVRAFADREPAIYAARSAQLGDASSAFAAALQGANPGAALQALSAAAEAIAALSRDCALPLVLEQHRQLSDLARKRGGSAKATGAGGGDLAVALFAEAQAAKSFADAARNSGMIVPALGVDASGLRAG